MDDGGGISLGLSHSASPKQQRRVFAGLKGGGQQGLDACAA